MPTAESVVALLNEAFALDPDAIAALVSNRVPCNGALAAHPTIPVRPGIAVGVRSVGLIGIINGLFDVRADGMGAIMAQFDHGKLTGFTVTPEPGA